MNQSAAEKTTVYTLSDSEDDGDNTTSFDFTKKGWKDDVAFLVEGRRLYASKSVLALVSPVFECMFGEQFAETYQDEVPLPGKKFVEFHEFLKCIYPTSHGPITVDNVTQLLPLADEYQVKSLTKKCDKFLFSHLLANEEVPLTYLLQCHEMAARYRLKDVRDICVNIISERQPEEVTEAKDILQESDSLLQLQSDVIKKQGRDREATRTELVKLYMNVDTSTNSVMADIIGFEFAKGASIEFRPSLSAVLQKQTQYSTPVRIWDLYFQLQLTNYIKHDGEQCLKLKLKCKFPNDGVSRFCETKSKILIKNQNDFPQSKHISHLLTNSYVSTEKPHLSYAQVLAPILRSDSGFVKKDKLLIFFHCLVNKPYEEGVAPENNQLENDT